MARRMRGHSSAGGRRGTERGAALVEFALLVPILMLLLMAFAEFGTAFYLKSALAGGVREGARDYARNSSASAAFDTFRNSINGGVLPAEINDPTKTQLKLTTCTSENACSGPFVIASGSIPTVSPACNGGGADYFTLAVEYSWGGISGGLVGGLVAIASGQPGKTDPLVITASTRMRCTPN